MRRRVAASQKLMKPFLLLQGPAAVKVAGSLKLSAAEAAEIDRLVFAHTYSRDSKAVQRRRSS